MTEDGYILGSIPSSLLNGEYSTHGFASVDDIICSRLTSPSFSTSTNPTYISFSYDILSNLTLNNQDTRIGLNRGLTVDDNIGNNLGVRCKGDTSLFESVDLK